ncbi:hypothetical protein JCM10213_000040 [Rhodosporidiobolus nylandii]
MCAARIGTFSVPMRSDCHTAVAPFPPFGVAPSLSSFRAWNTAFEQWLADAYAPSVDLWCKTEGRLAKYLSPAVAEGQDASKPTMVATCSRITVAVKLDKMLERWRALRPDQKEQLLVEELERHAHEVVQRRRGEERADCPELTLPGMLAEDGEGFVRLTEAFTYREPQDALKGICPTLPNKDWDRLMGVGEGSPFPSRARRAYVAEWSLYRNSFLAFFIDRVFERLPGDKVQRVAWAPRKPTFLNPPPPEVLQANPLAAAAVESGTIFSPVDDKRCALCETTEGKLLQCGRCLKIDRRVSYCSAAHQKEHWIHHKRICGKRREDLQA